MAKSKIPVNLTDLLMLAVVVQGEDYRSSLGRKYREVVKKLGGGDYANDTGVVGASLDRLHENGYVRTTGYRNEESGTGIVPHRYIEITGEGRKILERTVSVLNEALRDSSNQ